MLSVRVNLTLLYLCFKRGGADEEDRQRADKQSHCASHADLRFLAQIFFAEDAFELFRAPEHEERHEDDKHNHRANGDAENLIEGQATKVACIVVPVVKILFGFAEEECADESAEHEEHAVNFACRCGCQRGGGAEAADDKADAHDESAENAGPDIGGVDPDLAEIEDAKSHRAEEQNHGGDDRGEHDLEHGQFGEVELRGEFS